MSMIRNLLLALSVAILPMLASEVLAQTALAPSTRPMAASDGPDYRTWQSVASRAEAAVDARADSTELYETLRARIAGFRSAFSEAREANAERIATLRGQIEALGPKPEDDSEPPDIRERRAELDARLTELLAPVQVAEEAFTRADGLIGEIDTIIRERETKRLLSLGPSPLNPVSWPAAFQELAQAFADIGGERRAFSDPHRLALSREKLPQSLLLLAVGFVLVLRGRPWASAMGERLRQFGGRGTGVWRFLVSLGRIVLPLIGLLLITQGIFATGLLGIRGSELLGSLPMWGAILLGFRWLAERIFARHDDEALLDMPRQHRTEARFYIGLLALLIVARGFLELLLTLSSFSNSSHSVLAFPLVATTGLILFRLGQILYGYGTLIENEPGEEGPPRGAGLKRIVRWIGLAVMAVAIAAPIMAAIGYRAAGNALLYPMVLSLALLGFVMALQRFFADIYGWLSGQGAAGRDGLIPILISFVLLLMSAPVLALLWGARVANLMELWTAFQNGFAIGDSRISPMDFLTVALLFSAGYMLTRLLQSTLKSSVLPKTGIDPGGQTAIISGVGYVGIFLAALIAITGAGIDLSSLAIVAGALSVGIGFGLQNIVSNFVSGIILLIERPIAEGDWIEVGGQQGYVRDISVRSTRIETFDRSDVIVPNADLVSGTVTNYTRGNTVGRAIVPVGVAYGSDTRKIAAILQEIAESHPMVLMRPPPSVVFVGFGASSLDFEIRAILRDVNWMLSVKTELNHQIAERFVAEGIEIPFGQTDIWLRNPEALRMAGSANGKTASAAPTTVPDNDGHQSGEDADGDQGDST